MENPKKIALYLLGIGAALFAIGVYIITKNRRDQIDNNSDLHMAKMRAAKAAKKAEKAIENENDDEPPFENEAVVLTLDSKINYKNELDQ